MMRPILKKLPMTNKNLILTLYVLLFVALAVYGIYSYSKIKDILSDYIIREEAEQSADPHDSYWCYQELLPYWEDMTITENSAGTYEYQLYASKYGVEVWVPCKQLHD